MSGRPPVLPGQEELARLRRRHHRDRCLIVNCMGQRHTYEEIATSFGVSYSAVYQAMRKAGLTDEGSRRDHTDTLPWKLPPEDRYHRYAMRLRMLGQVRRRQTIVDEKMTHLVRWVREMIYHRLVVVYDLDGWWKDGWKPSDADLIRPPDYAGPEVYSDPEAAKIWSMSHLSADERRKLISSRDGG